VFTFRFGSRFGCSRFGVAADAEALHIVRPVIERTLNIELPNLEPRTRNPAPNLNPEHEPRSENTEV
jgi:hypothetical protein